jgi:hypothetical protein
MKRSTTLHKYNYFPWTQWRRFRTDDQMDNEYRLPHEETPFWVDLLRDMKKNKQLYE